LGFAPNQVKSLNQYILTVTAQDRPGIVAAVSGALLEMQGNIEAASQTVHQGYFTMILLCQFPDPPVCEAIVELIHRKAGADLHVYFTPYRCEGIVPPTPAQSYIITLIGPDRPGILHNLAGYLASRRINIDDLYSCVKDGDFIVICQVSVPAALDIRMLQADLESAGQANNFTAHVQHENIFVSINELSFGSVR
jgi:glycine cleavage system transcriptional repressor